MCKIVSQITEVSIACSTLCSGADQRKYQSSTLLAFVREIQGPVMQKIFQFDHEWWQDTHTLILILCLTGSAYILLMTSQSVTYDITNAFCDVTIVTQACKKQNLTHLTINFNHEFINCQPGKEYIYDENR